MIPIGDIVTIDGTEFECISTHPPSMSCLKEITEPGGHYYMRFMSDSEISDLETHNRLTYGRKEVQRAKQARCYHNWTLYRGLNKVEDYCTMCGSTKAVNWRDLK